MANKTLLNAVNEILKRVSLIGDAGELSSLTDSPRQVFIDLAVQVVNEGIDELYSTVSRPKPNQLSENTIVLATGTRNYSLQSDLVRLHWPLIDKTNTRYIFEHPRGYLDMLAEDPEQDDTGTAIFATIRPTDGNLFLDRAPGSDDNGNIYTYQYDKELVLSAAADTVPFNDSVFRSMVPAWAEMWKRERRKEFSEEVRREHFGRACRLLTETPQRTSWSPR